MDNLSKLLLDVMALPNLPAVIHEIPNGVEVDFPNNRRQQIEIENKGGYYRFSSVIIGSARVENRGASDMLRDIWIRNDEIDVVDFTLDSRKRLIGEVELLASHLDAKELAFYLICLAEECDRYEFILLGKDL
jgi:hypothetical protein